MNETSITFRQEDDAGSKYSRNSTIAVALFFAMVGFDKFTGGHWIQVFAEIGIGQWFRYLTGCIQIIGAGLMCFRKTWFVGIFLVAATMIGAMVAQISVLDGPGAAVVPGGLFGVLLIVAVIEWRRL